MQNITNITELRADLLEQYDSLKKDPRRLSQVAELSNVAGKVIASVKIQLENAAAIGVVPTIAFMDCEYKAPGTQPPIPDAKAPKQIKP
jgi:hypothetical protein